MTKKFFLLILAIGLSCLCSAQERLFDNYALSAKNFVKPLLAQPKSVSSTLTLPFIDDFSYDQNYPSTELWTDANVLINNNYAINPYSVGVATFDAVDFGGKHYNHEPGSHFVADKLTSQPIDLTSADSTSLYLSFYYQPQGNGNAPEEKDSLVLQVTPNGQQWYTIWRAEGTTFEKFKTDSLHLASNAPDTLMFKLVMLPISQSKFFTNQFQFRFCNYASTAGTFSASSVVNCDHWNIDFVYLNDKRSAADTTFFDMAFVEPAETMLKNYISIPWSHYESAIKTENTRIALHLRNHWNRNMKAEIRIRIKDEDSGKYLNDSITMGSANYDAQFNTKTIYSYDDNPIVYDSQKEANYLFECEMYVDKDELVKGNNKAYVHQHFGRYYSYDDGSAESSYGIDASDAQLAYLYSVYKPDYLQGISICFLQNNPVDAAGSQFAVCVWENANGKPGKLIYSQDVVRQDFTNQVNEFFNFEFDEPVWVEKSCFIGVTQSSNLSLNIGWDVNRYSQNKIFYNTTGNWLQTSFVGSLMMRPLFGEASDLVQQTTVVDNVKIVPNPATNHFVLQTDAEVGEVVIMNQTGAVVLCETNTSNIDVTNLQSGVYIVKIITTNGNVIVTKMIKL